jgi:predicted DNA-binding helix-hairpin-helix protein
MTGIVIRPNTQEKLEMLSTDAQYDLACACNTSREQSRKRSQAGTWIYPVTLPNGGSSVLFKTLMSNALSLAMDPKEAWAVNHPEQFPVHVNHALKWKLLRVPGLGPVTVRRILQERRKDRIIGIEAIGRVGKRLRRAEKYLTF